MNVSSVSLSQPSVDSLFTTLDAHEGTTLISGMYTRATLLHLVQSLETLALGGNAGALIVNSTFPSGTTPGQEHESATAIRRLALPIDVGWDQSELFLCVLGTTCSAVLCGKALGNAGSDEATRAFAVRWSIDPATIEVVLDLLEQYLVRMHADELAALQSARREFPLHQPDPELTLRLTADIISFDAHQHSVLSAKIRDLEARLRWHEDQTRMMVHDIRAPLHTLLMSIKSLLHQHFDPSSQQELLHMAYDSAQLLHDLTETATDALRLEAGRMPLNHQELRLQTLIQSVCEPLDLVTPSNRPSIRWIVDEHMPALWGDRGLLERVLTNLLTNAIKYTPPSGEVVVTAQLAADGRSIELTVGDTGKGIALEEQPYVFERFYQAKGSDLRKGLGVGLYFCRVAVEAHGGTISLASTPGVGSIFKVVLPLAQASQASETVTG